MAHVLVVDDEPGQRAMLRLLLEDGGHQVQEASAGELALDALRTAPERMVVLLDQIMPGLGGDEVLNIIAGDATLAARHAYILLTASPQRVHGVHPELLAQLNVPVVEKPFDMDALLQVVAGAAARLSPG
jgi:CheY-like chemotaxis protein